MPAFESAFAEIAALLLAAAIIGALALRLHQPLIVSYIAAGILVGPAGLGWVTAADEVNLLAKIGIALLLFVVGLKLDPGLVRVMGMVALVSGLAQMTLAAAAGYLIAVAMGVEFISALYVGMALAFSSTIIVVKLLSDQREIDSLHGRIAVGILIVQDIAVVLAMIGLAAFGEGDQATTLPGAIALIVLKGAIFLALIGLLMRYVLTRLLHSLASSLELLVLFAIAWAIGLAAVSESLGFGKELGAFLGGISLASTPYRETIGSRLVTLRDFLLLFFFIDLGARVDLGLIRGQLAPAVLLSIFTLIGKPLIVMVIAGLMGYRKRTGFLAGVTLAQISEFSLILAALGISLGHIADETMALITLVALTTISLSTYMIKYSHPLYERVAHWLGPFERQITHREEAGDSAAELTACDAIVFGLGRFGGNIARGLSDRGWEVLGVDFDPALVEARRMEGLLARYGDAEDQELVALLPLPRDGWVIGATPERHVNLALIAALRQLHYGGRVAVRATSVEDAAALELAGADVVFRPFVDAAKEAVDVLDAFGDAVASAD